MGKSKVALNHSIGLPTAPWIYVNDSTPDGAYAYQIAALIPCTLQVAMSRTSASVADLISVVRSDKYRETVAIISDQKHDHESYSKLKTIKLLREAAIKHGCNFASINIINDPTFPVSETDNFGTNHLNIYAYEKQLPEKIYKWLYSVFTVREHLYLIPEEQMKEIDTKTFPDYEYCPIKECHLRPKDARLQFVALILTKPEITNDQRLTWTVADRSGVGNFYFQYRGPECQFTWDWVLALKPGDRKVLPRMPMVRIEEKNGVKIVKAPFRATAAIIGGVGFVIKSVGKGVSRIGNTMKLGESSEWVPEVDVDVNGKKKKATWADESNVTFVPPVKKTTIKVFNEKGEKAWSDNDSNVSTQAGSVFDENDRKELV